MNARNDNLNIEEVEIAIAGSGFAGLGMAIQLRKAGILDFIVLEKASDIGGTWRDNHYPGCACDVPSHVYSYSFAQNPDWSETYSPQAEIWAYMKKCAKDFGVNPHLRLNHGVAKAEWNESLSRWFITIDNGKIVSARHFIPAMGPLSKPAIPDIASLKDFKGEVFHSQQWNHDYKIHGKRIAVIGTGASAIQFVPHVAKEAARLDLYQRTPPWVLPKLNRRFSNLEHLAFKYVPGAQNGLRKAIYWLMEAQVFGMVLNPKLMKGLEALAKSNYKKHIKDPELLKKVVPDYTIGCKRILYTNNYLPALAQPHVNVVTDGIEKITADGIVSKTGETREVDAIILGTGFQATAPVERGFIFGKGGQDLLDAWSGGMEAYKGATVSGFPNLFFIVGPNTGLGHSSIIFMIEAQVNYILKAIETARKKNLTSLDIKPEALETYNAKLQEKLGSSVWAKGGCSSWYMDENGKNTTLWPGFTWQFRLMTNKFDLADYVATSETHSTTQATPMAEEA